MESKEKERHGKQILDRWATAVIPKEAIFLQNDVAQVNSKKIRHYEERGYKGDEVLWIAPKDCIRFEFEMDSDSNHRMVLEIESAAKSLGFDYCITGHGGTSDYFNMFNIKGMPLGEDNSNAKLMMADLMMPSKYKDFLDRTNLGWTLSPVINHPHWKPKYNGAVHKILRGKNPLEHENTFPKELKTLLKKAKKWYEKQATHIRLSSSWVEDFLTNYCCNTELPKGSRHFIIEKNLAAFLLFRKDKEEIKKRYYAAQGRKHDSLRSWERAILSGKYTEVSPGELAGYIKKHGLNYDIPYEKIEEQKQKKDPIESEKELLSIQQFKDPDLINYIYKEIDRDHLRDDHAKMTAVLVASSAYLAEEESRQSMNVKGDSSTGKNSAVESVLKHFPDRDWLKITRGTTAALEDDIGGYKIIFLNEVNQFREGGANSMIIETIKQLTEGGTTTLKKDAATGFKTTLNIQQEQKTVFTTTTDLLGDEERETRFIECTILNNPNTTKKVNILSMERAADINYLLKKIKPQKSWLQRGIENLPHNKVLLPFMKELTALDIFDVNNARSKRDVKRLIGLTKAVSFLYQLQRYKIKVWDETIILGEPEDLYNAILISGGFLNQSYKGYDQRLDVYSEKIAKLSKEPRTIKYKNDKSEIEEKTIYAAPRHEIEKEIGKSKNTIKDKLKILRDMGLVSCRQYGNIWYYERCQTGCQSQFLGVKIEDIKNHLKRYDKDKIDTLLTPIDTLKTAIIKPVIDHKAQLWGHKVSISPEHTELLINLSISSEKVEETIIKKHEGKQKVKIDTLKLTPYDLVELIRKKPDYPMQQFSEEHGEPIMQRLLSDGEIYEHKPGYLRAL